MIDGERTNLQDEWQRLSNDSYMVGAIEEALHQKQILADGACEMIDNQLTVTRLNDDGSIADRRKVTIWLSDWPQNAT